MLVHIVADSPFACPVHRLWRTAWGGETATILVTKPTGARYPVPDGAMLATHANLLTLMLRVTRRCKSDCTLVVNGVRHACIGDKELSRFRKIWVLWGGEVYATSAFNLRVLPGPKLLMRRTRSLLPRSMPERIYNAISDLSELRAQSKWSDYFSSFDYCVCKFAEEFGLIQSSLRLSGVRHFENPAAPLEEVVTLEEGATFDDYCVLVGNSADPANNHVEVLMRLRELGMPETGQIVIPLGYGNTHYKQKLISVGRELLGSQLQPLVDFLPLDAYNQAISGCGVVIMNHLRQQALGNIVSALNRGAIVYLNDTPVYQGLLRMGFDVRRVSSLTSAAQLQERISNDTVEKHRRLLHEEWGRERVAARLKKLLESLA